MPFVLQINTVANIGSTGRIADHIHKAAKSQGWWSIVTYGRGSCNIPNNDSIKVGSKFDVYIHGVMTRLFDRHGLASSWATRSLIKKIKKLKPDIIHLHNLHGYYLNYKMLFQYLNQTDIPVVWTLHDCWAFTGHCAHFTTAGCYKWQTQCNNCPNKGDYPASIWCDRSRRNFELKKELFSSNKNLTIVAVSEWLKENVKKSFFANCNIEKIYNGINLSIFSPADKSAIAEVRQKYGISPDKKIVLGVANVLDEKKGLNDFITLRLCLPDEYSIVLVGTIKPVQGELPEGITTLSQIDSLSDLSAIYSAADVFVNPTWEESLGLTNIEALACGTPVVAYCTGGSPEVISDDCGAVVEQGNVSMLASHIVSFCSESDRDIRRRNCRRRAEELFSREKMTQSYIDLYNRITAPRT